ncbi:divalent-cation tolerance protein CutA [Nitrospira sp. KM1]|uniref:divalent-cation tolerance protein CutA n=1 Tax=Nitrospira sp. KM1 TaxID=1936990 RepID=UPI0015638BD4
MKRQTPKILLIIVSCPNKPGASRIARAVIDRRLAACANIVDRVRSIYRWKRKIVEEHEVLVLFKTTDKQYSQLERFLLDIHPYDNPEIIAISLFQGSPNYLEWVSQEVQLVDGHK